MSRTGYNKPKLCLDCKTFIGYIRGNPKRCKDCARIAENKIRAIHTKEYMRKKRNESKKP